MIVDPSGLCQIEFYVRDVSRAVEFYAKVMGWDAVPADIHGYTILDVPKKCGFGIALVPDFTVNTGDLDERENKGPILYFHCQNPEAVLARVPQCYGRLIGPMRSLPGYGIVQCFEDPDGNRFGLFQGHGSESQRDGR